MSTKIEFFFEIKRPHHGCIELLDRPGKRRVPAAHVPSVVVQDGDVLSSRNGDPLIAGASEPTVLGIRDHSEPPTPGFELRLESGKHLGRGIGRVIVDDDQITGHLGVVQKGVQTTLRPVHLVEDGNHNGNGVRTLLTHSVTLAENRSLEHPPGGSPVAVSASEALPKRMVQIKGIAAPFFGE